VKFVKQLGNAKRNGKRQKLGGEQIFEGLGGEKVVHDLLSCAFDNIITRNKKKEIRN
jgi:hypothetical protein